MNLKTFKRGNMKIGHIHFLLILLLVPLLLPAQWEFSTHFDAGEHNASNGLYVRNGSSAAYEFGETKFTGRMQIDLKSSLPYVLTGVAFDISHAFRVGEFPLSASGFFMYNRFSELLFETAGGLLAHIERDHFHAKLGTGFRSFRLTPAAIEITGEDSDPALSENWNMVYSLGYQIKPADHPWNAGIALTNLDHFLMNQETNPMLYVHGNYEVIPDLDLFMEAWYKHAGVFNISANYFGFFFRTGVIWNLKK